MARRARRIATEREAPADTVRAQMVAALEKVERLIADEVFAGIVALEGVERPTQDEWQDALNDVRAALAAARGA